MINAIGGKKSLMLLTVLLGMRGTAGHVGPPERATGLGQEAEAGVRGGTGHRLYWGFHGECKAGQSKHLRIVQFDYYQQLWAKEKLLVTWYLPWDNLRQENIGLLCDSVKGVVG